MNLNINHTKLILILSVLGIAVSLYLIYVKLTSSTVICGIGDCGAVQNSKYSQLFGIPVAAFGVLYYFVMFALTYVLEQKPNKTLTTVKYLWVLWGVGFSVYLTYLELYVIHAICMWCVISLVVVLLIAVVSAVEWKKNAIHKL